MPLCRVLRVPFLSAAFLVGFLALLLAPEQGLAHRVNVFAWIEGPQVAVECAFSGGKSVRQGLITVFDAATGAKLLEGRTDDGGNFRFNAPPQGRAHGLRIRVNAGEGHQNEWVLDAAELAATATPPAQEALPAPATAPPAALPADRPASAAAALPSGGAAPALTPEAVRQVVDAALEHKLAPLRRDLAQLRAQGPRLTEIVGGIGWLVGLAGLGLYFKGRRG